MSSILPNAERGYLPYFLLYDGLAALIHSLCCYLIPPVSALAVFRGHSAPPPTTLLAHTYALKNIYTGSIRLVAAYSIGAAQQYGSQNRAVYDLTILTLLGVLGFFGTEMFIWGTTRTRDITFSLCTAGTGVVWMLMQREYYLS